MTAYSPARVTCIGRLTCPRLAANIRSRPRKVNATAGNAAGPPAQLPGLSRGASLTIFAGNVQEQRASSLWLRRGVSAPVVIGLVVLAGLIAAVVSLAVMRSRLQRRIDAELAAIRRAGYPVTWQELDRWYTRPASNDFTAVYTNIFAQLPDESQVPTNLPFYGSAKLDSMLGQPLPPDLQAAIRSHLATNAAPIRALCEIHGVPACRYPVDFSRGFAATMPHLRKVRQGARLLGLQTVLYAEDNHSQAATDTLLAGAALANSLQRESHLLSRLGLIACHGINLSAMEWSLSRTAFTDTQLASLMAALAESENLDGMAFALTGERTIVLGTFMAVRSGKYQLADFVWLDGQPFHRLLTEHRFIAKIIELGWRGFSFAQRDMLVSIELENSFVAAAQQPLEKRLAAATANARRAQQVPKYCLLTREILSPIDAAVKKDLCHLAQLRIAHTALAVERYRLAHGTLPENLSELVPALLPAVPRDPFTGEPLHYVRRQPGFTVYSVGPDGRDDGGVKRKPGGREFEPGTDIPFTVVR